MTINDEIITIANQLADKGIVPSVATIKAKLSVSAPLPTIINTLKTWQYQPDHMQKKQNSEPDISVEQDNTSALEIALKPLFNELVEIRVLLKSLNDKLD